MKSSTDLSFQLHYIQFVWKREWFDETCLLVLAFLSTARHKVVQSSKTVGNAFSQADKHQFLYLHVVNQNWGDVSPNVLGAYCLDTGLPCNSDHSTTVVKVNYVTVRNEGMYLQNSESSLRIKIKQILNCF